MLTPIHVICNGDTKVFCRLNFIWRNVTYDCATLATFLIVGHPEPEKKVLLAFLSTFWHPCSKCILMCFKEDRGGCQVWKCPKVPELGQRSTECKFLYIRQNFSVCIN